MAAHIETGTMVPPRYRSQTLDHLGLVAGMYDEIGIGERAINLRRDSLSPPLES